MGIIQRQVLGETVKVFVVVTVAMLALMTTAGGAREAVRNGLPPELVLQTIPFLVPEVLQFTIPGSLLLAVCTVFGRMAASNEFIALKSCGIRPMKVIWPILSLAVFLSLATFLLYDVSAVWARPGLRRLTVESVDRIALGYLRANRSYAKDGLSITVRRVEEDVLIKPTILVAGGRGKPEIRLAAQTARLSFADDTGLLKFTCQEGQIEVGDQAKVVFPDHFEQSVQLVDRQSQRRHLSPSWMSSRLIPNEIARKRLELAALAITGEEDDLAEARSQQKDQRTHLYRLRAETPRRLANGFACLGFVVIGMSVAMWARSADMLSVFFVCFLPILVVYYPLLVVGEMIARAGVLPELSVWLADGVLFTVGTILLLKLNRH